MKDTLGSWDGSSVGLVIACMVAYYRFSGIVASCRRPFQLHHHVGSASNAPSNDDPCQRRRHHLNSWDGSRR